MAEIEFRGRATRFDTEYEKDAGQPSLPVEIAGLREVHWVHGEIEVKRRLIGSKAVMKYVMEDELFIPKMTFIDTDAIPQLNDPKLRYALRFADAVEAMGETQDSSDYRVWVVARDAGIDSECLDAEFGIGSINKGSAFLDFLKTAQPDKP